MNTALAELARHAWVVGTSPTMTWKFGAKRKRRWIAPAPLQFGKSSEV